MVRSSWKGKVVQSDILNKQDMTTVILNNRNLFLFNELVGLNLKVYNGREWLDIIVDVTQVYFNLSVFIFTRKMLVIHNLKKEKKILKNNKDKKKKHALVSKLKSKKKGKN